MMPGSVRRWHCRRDLSSRIAAPEIELEELRRRQHAELVFTITTIIGIVIAFTACELDAHALVSIELRSALAEVGITSPRTLGKRWERMHRETSGEFYIERRKSEHGRALWRCGVTRRNL